MEIKISETALKTIAFVAVTIAVELIRTKYGSSSSSDKLECVTDNEVMKALDEWTLA